MSPDPVMLDALIESVADGSPVDWRAMEAAAVDDRARRRLRQLKLVAAIAEVHRTLPDEPIDERLPDLPPAAGGVAHWGHLLLLERIGEGSFGEVHHARDAWLDRDVALKLLKPTTSGDANARALREARTLARVRHLNVVTVHGADMHNGRVGLWMELLRGRTLEQQLASQGPFGAREAALIGIDVCRALAAIHAAGLVHRDIKAANVMREDGGRIVLMDLGTGRDIVPAAAPALQNLAGTPLYLAPEILSGAPASERTDLYSLGVLLYHLVTGAFPIRAAAIDELRAAHERTERRYLQDARPDLPDAFVTVVERATEPDPQQRYASAGEMQHALSSVVSSTPSRIDERPAPLSGRRRSLAAAAILFIAVAAAAGFSMWRAFRQPSADVPGHVSLLAVLPFHNLSADAGEAYLASAVPMELTARLGQIGALRVVPWTFMARFDATGQRSLKAVADRTGADAVVEGSVQRLPAAATGSPGPVQVRVQIYEAGTGTLLWSASFERDISDFFALQAQIARDVAARVHVVLAAREQAIVSRTRRVPPQAMEDYLRGRHLLEIEVNLQDAVESFRRAIERAPGFAEAYVGLASAYSLESAYFGRVSSAAALQRGLDASSKAIELDSNLPEAWGERAFARYTLEWNWLGAESDFKHALELGPAAVEVLDSYSNYLTSRGRHAEAIDAASKAEEHAPLSAPASRQLAWAYYMARQYDPAIQQLHRTLEIEPGFVPARTLLGRAYALKGMHAESIRELESVGDDYHWMLALAYAMSGRPGDAERLLDQIRSPSSGQPVVAYHVASVYAALNDAGHALDWLETAYREKDASLVHLGVDPMLDPVRATQRFQILLTRLDFHQ